MPDTTGNDLIFANMDNGVRVGVWGWVEFRVFAGSDELEECACAGGIESRDVEDGFFFSIGFYGEYV